MKFPLTYRGIIALIAGLYLIMGPAKNSADLIASLLGISLILLGLGFAIITLVYGTVLKRNFKPTLSSPDGEIVSGQETTLLINCERTSLTPLSVPPLFVVKVSIEFAEKEIKSAIHQLLGLAKKKRILYEHLTFPHRGNWRIKGFNISVGDRFGLTEISWLTKQDDIKVRVVPGGTSDVALPIISSTQRDGDDIDHPLERTGEPFDLKPYHPSDGMRKILWKVYAKSGELISRHPERSMTPEGKVVIFIAARTIDDSTCQMAIEYIKKLEDLSLQIWAGCSGIAKVKSAPARSAITTRDLLIETAWQSGWTGGDADLFKIKSDIDYLLANIPAPTRVTKMPLFMAREGIQSAGSVELLRQVGAYLASLGIEPIFCIQGARWPDPTPRATSINLDSPIAKFLFNNNGSSNHKDVLKFYPEFIKICAQTNWQVIL